MISFFSAKVRLSENKTKKMRRFFCFVERKYLRPKVKGTIKREQNPKKEAFFCFVERKYLRPKVKGTIKREQNQKKEALFLIKISEDRPKT